MRSEFKRMMPALFLMGKLTPNSCLTPSAIGDTSAKAALGDGRMLRQQSGTLPTLLMPAAVTAASCTDKVILPAHSSQKRHVNHALKPTYSRSLNSVSCWILA